MSWPYRRSTVEGCTRSTGRTPGARRTRCAHCRRGPSTPRPLLDGAQVHHVAHGHDPVVHDEVTLLGDVTGDALDRFGAEIDAHAPAQRRRRRPPRGEEVGGREAELL